MRGFQLIALLDKMKRADGACHRAAGSDHNATFKGGRVMADSQPKDVAHLTQLDESTVEYRPVDGFPGYRVGSDGTIWSCLRRSGRNCATPDGNWRLLNPSPLRGGYVPIGLRRDGRTHYRLVHRLVLEAFVGPCPEGMEACHGPDNNPRNNSIENLAWGTPKENAADRDRNGTTARGERNGFARLTADDVRAIRMNVEGLTQSQWGKRLGVAQTTISAVVRGKGWASC